MLPMVYRALEGDNAVVHQLAMSVVPSFMHIVGKRRGQSSRRLLSLVMEWNGVDSNGMLIQMMRMGLIHI